MDEDDEKVINVAIKKGEALYRLLTKYFLYNYEL